MFGYMKYKQIVFYLKKRHLEPYQGGCKVDLLGNLSILKFVFFILDRNFWPKIVITSQCSITMANERLLVFICKIVEIIFVKEDQGRDFFIVFRAPGFAEILNVVIEMFSDFYEDFATGTIILFGTYSLFSLPDISLN